MTRLSDAPHHRRASFTNRRLAALIGSALIAPALVLAQVLHGTHVDTWIVVGGASALTLLVIGRMSLNIDELPHDRPAAGRAAADAAARGLPRLPDRRPQPARCTRSWRPPSDGASGPGPRSRSSWWSWTRSTSIERHGHTTNEHLLRATADRLGAASLDPEHVGRLHGGLFVVCVDDAQEAEVHGAAERLIQVVAEPIPLDGSALEVSACVGAAVSMDGGTEPDDLVEQAHVALRRAQATARGTFEVFGEGLRREMLERRATEEALRAALDEDVLELHYQPIVAVQSEIVDGYEARVHWRRPGLGWQDSDDFLAVAALSDLICRIDLWAVARPCGTWRPGRRSTAPSSPT